MNALQSALEWHDTTVDAIVQVGTQIIILLRAYVHKSEGRPGWDAGSGWIQAAAMTFAEAVVEGEVPELPSDIWTGSLTVDGNERENIEALSFDCTDDVVLRMRLEAPLDTVVRGKRVTMTLLGEAVYVEEFSSTE